MWCGVRDLFHKNLKAYKNDTYTIGRRNSKTSFATVVQFVPGSHYMKDILGFSPHTL